MVGKMLVRLLVFASEQILWRETIELVVGYVQKIDRSTLEIQNNSTHRSFVSI